jgi:hypothetical protein
MQGMGSWSGTKIPGASQVSKPENSNETKLRPNTDKNNVINIFKKKRFGVLKAQGSSLVLQPTAYEVSNWMCVCQPCVDLPVEL